MEMQTFIFKKPARWAKKKEIYCAFVFSAQWTCRRANRQIIFHELVEGE
jgi:hypothetical protein